MKNIKTGLIAVILMFAASSAFADNQSGGAYVGGGIGIYSGGTTISAATTSFDLGTIKADVGLNLYGGYKFNIGDAGSIAGEVSYNSSVGKDITFYPTPTTNVDLKLTNNFSVSVMPGYNLTRDTTSYLRLGYTQVKGEMTGSAIVPTTHTYSGYVVGFGIDQAVKPNLSARLEYRILRTSSWTDMVNNATFQPFASGLDLSVRYAF
jgi:opacity protein-like surface antigen